MHVDKSESAYRVENRTLEMVHNDTQIKQVTNA